MFVDFFVDLEFCNHSILSVVVIENIQNRDGRGSYFFHGAGRGGERQGKKSNSAVREPILMKFWHQIL